MKPKFKFEAVKTSLIKMPEYIEHLETNKIPMGQKALEERHKGANKVLLRFSLGDSISIKEFEYVSPVFEATVSFIIQSPLMYWKVPVIYSCMEASGIDPTRCTDIFKKIGKKFDKRCSNDVNDCIKIRKEFGRDSEELEYQLENSLIQAPGELVTTSFEMVNGNSIEIDDTKRQTILSSGLVMEINSTEDRDFLKYKFDKSEGDITRRQDSQEIIKILKERSDKRNNKDQT